MASEIFDPSVSQTITAAQAAARQRRTKPVTVSGAVKVIPSPFPSPADWRDTWILNATPHRMTIAHSNRSTSGTRMVRQIGAATFFGEGGTTRGPAAALDVTLQPSEVQVWTPV